MSKLGTKTKPKESHYNDKLKGFSF